MKAIFFSFRVLDNWITWDGFIYIYTIKIIDINNVKI